MKRIVDTLTGDLFASIPVMHPKTAGGWLLRNCVIPLSASGNKHSTKAQS